MTTKGRRAAPCFSTQHGIRRPRPDQLIVKKCAASKTYVIKTLKSPQPRTNSRRAGVLVGMNAIVKYLRLLVLILLLVTPALLLSLLPV